VSRPAAEAEMQVVGFASKRHLAKANTVAEPVDARLVPTVPFVFS